VNFQNNSADSVQINSETEEQKRAHTNASIVAGSLAAGVDMSVAQTICETAETACEAIGGVAEAAETATGIGEIISGIIGGISDIFGL